MRTCFHTTRVLWGALCLNLLALSVIPSSFVPNAFAANPCDTIRDQIRAVRVKLAKSKEIADSARRQKTSKRLKRQLRQLRSNLATCVSLSNFTNMVDVGNAGNPSDPADGDELNGGVQHFGAVAYDFRIGKTEVTLNQYVSFLNAVAKTDTYGLYNPTMATNQNVRGITRTGSSGNYAYTVIGSGNHPVTYVNWFDAARFCNWLHNGRPSGAQGSGTTETGAYALNGADNGVGFVRETGARFWIPSEDEWYKAAYHHPAANGGPALNYWIYPTRSVVPPDNLVGGGANQANCKVSNKYSVTQNTTLVPTQNYLSNAGAYSGSPSHYGTFDQAGSNWEWTDGINGMNRIIRGGGWNNDNLSPRSSNRPAGYDPTLESDSTVGFRIAGQ